MADCLRIMIHSVATERSLTFFLPCTKLFVQTHHRRHAETLLLQGEDPF